MTKKTGNTVYKVTWGNGNLNEYNNIEDAIIFLELNKIESFTVTQGEDNHDLTTVVQSILNWRR
jgi:hypothetical protein